MMAGLSPCPAATWRSTQLWQILMRPPRNHFAYGAFHSSTRSHDLNQSSSLRACSAQNVSGSAIERLYISRYCSNEEIRARAANSAGGRNTRSSFNIEVISLAATLAAV